MRPPDRIVHATAPVRICDLGGWTDTWFAAHGRVVNVAVEPGVEVRVETRDRDDTSPRALLYIGDSVDGDAVDMDRLGEGPHPLLEAALAEAAVPERLRVDVRVRSHVPVGSAVGTSAATVVALLGALDRVNGADRSAPELARAAHRVEVDRLGWQSGIQDQWAAAVGGINVIDMAAYPEATCRSVEPSSATWRELERRLVVVYLGRPHTSSAVHDLVIAELRNEGPSSVRLERLRRCADAGAAALEREDLDAFGQAMIENNEAQAALHPDLVSADAARLIGHAAAAGAVAWKVNGAGGRGGSVSILCGTAADARERVIAAVCGSDPMWRVLPCSLTRVGLRVWSSG